MAAPKIERRRKGVMAGGWGKGYGGGEKGEGR